MSKIFADDLIVYGSGKFIIQYTILCLSNLAVLGDKKLLICILSRKKCTGFFVNYDIRRIASLKHS